MPEVPGVPDDAAGRGAANARLRELLAERDERIAGQDAEIAVLREQLQSQVADLAARVAAVAPVQQALVWGGGDFLYVGEPGSVQQVGEPAAARQAPQRGYERVQRRAATRDRVQPPAGRVSGLSSRRYLAPRKEWVRAALMLVSPRAADR